MKRQLNLPEAIVIVTMLTFDAWVVYLAYTRGTNIVLPLVCVGITAWLANKWTS